MNRRNVNLPKLMWSTFFCGVVFNPLGMGPGKAMGSVEQLEQFLTQEIQDVDIERIGFAAIKNFKKGMERDFGDSSALNTPYQAGSISKVVSTYIALKELQRKGIDSKATLASQGQLDYFDGIECALPQNNWRASLVFDHLFTHTSGMGTDVLGNERCLTTEPGASFSYSGAGFHYLQHTIESISAKGLGSLANDHVFEPLNLRQSTFALEMFDQVFVNAAFSLVSTPGDVAVFFGELARSEDMVWQAMREEQVQLNPQLYWGRGLGIYHCGSDKLLWHWGSNIDRFHTLAAVFESTGQGIVLMVEGEKVKSRNLLKKAVLPYLGCPELGYWDDVP